MPTQYSLFSSKPEKTGYRLQYFEMFNWGTFNKKVYRIAPQGENSLLTGANASGKSTLIDALVTLIVPSKKDRFYNQSSGLVKKGDRTEETYVLGNHGNNQVDGESGVTTETLRTKNDYSVLLATFKNSDMKTISIFQVRWFSTNELRCVYGFSSLDLSIKEDFSDFDGKGMWRKKLEAKYNKPNLSNKQIEFYDGSRNYTDKLYRSFCMKSDKALSLFSQVVGVKVLDDLDEFIRTKMLEKRDSEEQFVELDASFRRLIEAKNNFDKVSLQIEMLKPISDIVDELSTLKTEIDNLERLKQLAVVWFANRYAELAEKELSDIDERISGFDKEIEEIKNNQASINEEISGLNSDIQGDSTGRRIKELESKNRTLETQRQNREEKLKEFNNILAKLGMPTNPDEENFYKLRENAKIRKVELDKYLVEQDEKIRTAKNAVEHTQLEISNNKNTVLYLRQNKCNIAGRVAEIRDEIINAVGASSEEIPFIGELIRVKDNEIAWGKSIEKIMHNYALRLIVPKEYYKQVNEYVNKNSLNGRIIYQKYEGDSDAYLSNFSDINIKPNSLLKKIEFKPKNKYSVWLESVVKKRFNYCCVNSLEEFNNEPAFAVTREGLIKADSGKHEKDDRNDKDKADNHVLGWDNKDKIAALLRLINEKETIEKEQKDEVSNLVQDKKVMEDKRNNYYLIYNKHSKFDDIDVRSYALEIEANKKRIEELQASNDRVKNLQAQVDALKERLLSLDSQYKQKIEDRTSTKNERQRISTELIDYKNIVINNQDIDISEFERKVTDLGPIDFHNIISVQKKFQSNNETELEIANGNRYKKENEISDLIRKFKYPDISIKEKFPDWYLDANQLPDAKYIDMIGAYKNKYEQLVNEDILKFEKQFNEYLKENVLNKVSEFRQFFSNWEKSIRNTIEKLNDSLRSIDFRETPNTYIQLDNTSKLSEDVILFKDFLKKSLPNMAELDATKDGRRNHFDKVIYPFIQKLRNDQWRKNVTDVRSWFYYKADEYNRTTGEKFKVYEGMGQLSGGEKAQLTYTILGSAIAYQFGLTKEGMESDSFRFIAIDEAFKAQDEDKARYLLSLCKQLKLQLLVVTPSDNINIVEDNISFVHYVQRKDNESILLDMPIKQFKQEREKYLDDDSTERNKE